MLFVFFFFSGGFFSLCVLFFNVFLIFLWGFLGDVAARRGREVFFLFCFVGV